MVYNGKLLILDWYSGNGHFFLAEYPGLGGPISVSNVRILIVDTFERR